MAPSLAGLIAVAIVMVSCARHANAQGTEASDGVQPGAIPLPTLQIERTLEPIVREMCRRSPTFRRQLIRLADAPGLVVTVATWRVRPSSHAEATTRFGREDGLLRRAEINLVADVYVFDTLTHDLARVSGARAQSPWWEASTGPSLDAAGRVIAFSSRHPIDPSDVKHDFDLFVEEVTLERVSGSL